MPAEPTVTPIWWLRGLLFENCSCQLLCPAHVSFKQTCSPDACVGHWAVRVMEGAYGATRLDGLNAVIVFESPVRMYEGGWVQRLYLDERATPAQREALETVFTGAAGGPWETLGQFVATRLDTTVAPVLFEDQGAVKVMRVPGHFETTVTALRGSDGDGRVTLSNLYNVIHGLVHTLGRGASTCQDPRLRFSIKGTHGLYSTFAWTGGPAAGDASVS